jgi:hypothetical protein
MKQLEVLKSVVTKLGLLGIEYMLSGSVAMNFYGQPRMTRDLDIVVVIESADVEPFVALFREEFYVDRSIVEREVQTRGMFNLIHNEYVVKVDFIVRKEGEYGTAAFDRRRTITMDDMLLFIISAEDLILNKLLWARESASELQRRDVTNILAMAEDLDANYLKTWAERLGVAAMLNGCAP